jgi:DNA polymerase elongation subunit (family B)
MGLDKKRKAFETVDEVAFPSESNNKDAIIWENVDEEGSSTVLVGNNSKKLRNRLLKSFTEKNKLQAELTRYIALIEDYQLKHEVKECDKLKLLQDYDAISKLKHEYDDPKSRVRHPQYDFSKYRSRRVIKNPYTVLKGLEYVDFYLNQTTYRKDADDKLYLEIYGIIKIGEIENSCTIRAYDVVPHLFVKRPYGFTGEDIESFKLELNNALSRRKKPDEGRITRISFERCGEYEGYSRDIMKDFIRIDVDTPKVVATLREVLTAPGGGTLIRTNKYGEMTEQLPKWDAIQFGFSVDKNGFSNAEVFEADVDFNLRCLVDHGFTPSTWFQIPVNRVEVLERGKYRSDLVLSTSIYDMRPHPDSAKRLAIPDFVKLTLDSEFVVTQKRFPILGITPCCTVVLRLRTKKNGAQDFCFSWGYMENVRNRFTDVFWYNSEAAMLRGLYEFMVELDPDIIRHFNGNQFDMPYLAARAEKLGIHEFNYLGRKSDEKMTCAVQVKKNKKTYTLAIPGRLNEDVLRRLREEKQWDDFTLNASADKILGRKKEEFDVELLEYFHQSKAGREHIALYCAKDTELTDEISEKENFTQVDVETSRLAGVQIQTIRDRQTSVKVEGKIRHECSRYEVTLPDGERKVIKLLKRCKKQQVKEGKFKGADVITPIPGFYDETVLVFDCQSEYPSCIIEENTCPTTKIRRKDIEAMGLKPEDIIFVNKRVYVDGKFESVVGKDGKKDLVYRPGKIDTVEDPNGPAFVKPHIRLGILPRLEKTLWEERDKIRKKDQVKIRNDIEDIQGVIIEILRKYSEYPVGGLSNTAKKGWIKTALNHLRFEFASKKDDSLLKGDLARVDELISIIDKNEYEFNRLDARQNAIKIWMNSIYGATGANTSIYKDLDIAETITATGRWLINFVKNLIESTYNRANGYNFDAIVIYGDTDSVFVWLKGFGRCVPAAFTIGNKIKEMLNLVLKAYPPFQFNFEKIYLDLCLIAAKNYFGLKHNPPGSESHILKTESKGVKYKKRGTSNIAKNTAIQCVNKITVESNLEAAIAYARKVLDDIKMNRINLGDYIIKASINKDLDAYVTTKKDDDGVVISEKPAKRAPVVLARKLVKRNEGLVIGEGTYLSYVIIKGVGTMSDRAELPEIVIAQNLEVDRSYYFDELSNILLKVFAGPLGYGMKPGTHEDKMPQPYYDKKKDSNLSDKGKLKYKLSTLQKAKIVFEIFGICDPKNIKYESQMNYDVMNFNILSKKVCLGCSKEMKHRHITIGGNGELDDVYCSDCKHSSSMFNKLNKNDVVSSYLGFKKAMDTCIKCLGTQSSMSIVNCTNYSCENFSMRLSTGRQFELAFSRELVSEEMSDLCL